MIFSNGYIPSTKRILNFPSFSSQDQMFSTDRECPSCQFFPRPGSLSPCRLCSLLWHWRILACNHQPGHHNILLWLDNDESSFTMKFTMTKMMVMMVMRENALIGLIRPHNRSGAHLHYGHPHNPTISIYIK